VEILSVIKAREKTKDNNGNNQLKVVAFYFFYSICDVMPMCENQNGGTSRHSPSWFTIEILLNEYIKEMEKRPRYACNIFFRSSNCTGDRILIKMSRNVYRSCTGDVREMYPIIHNWDLK